MDRSVSVRRTEVTYRVLPRAVALFRRRNPGVRISIRSLPTPLVVERVAQREVDMGIVYAPVADGGVDEEDLVQTELACVVPQGHPFAARRLVKVGDLEGYPVISHRLRCPRWLLFH